MMDGDRQSDVISSCQITYAFRWDNQTKTTSSYWLRSAKWQSRMDGRNAHRLSESVDHANQWAWTVGTTPQSDLNHLKLKTNKRDGPITPWCKKTNEICDRHTSMDVHLLPLIIQGFLSQRSGIWGSLTGVFSLQQVEKEGYRVPTSVAVDWRFQVKTMFLDNKKEIWFPVSPQGHEC